MEVGGENDITTTDLLMGVCPLNHYLTVARRQKPALLCWVSWPWHLF